MQEQHLHTQNNENTETHLRQTNGEECCFWFSSSLIIHLQVVFISACTLLVVHCEEYMHFCFLLIGAGCYALV